MFKVRNVSLSYHGSNGAGPLKVLDDVSLCVEKGHFVVLLGPSGCGKTTLLNLMAGFAQPDSGEVTFDGATVSGPGRERGVAFQKHALLPWLNVVDNAAFALKLRGVPKKQRRKQAMELLARLGLEDNALQPVYELSGGMQQRLGLARLLASDPRMLLMDEPFGALDEMTRENMQELILELWAATGKMVFFITHSVEEAVFLATRLLVMSPEGRIAASFDASFSARRVSGENTRSIKSCAAYIAMREEVLRHVRRENGERHG